MAHGRDKDRSRRNRLIVRQPFNEEWDPIGGCPPDEYDAYASKAYVMLMDEEASVDRIADYLWRVETEHMGISPREGRREKCREIASKLHRMKLALSAANDE